MKEYKADLHCHTTHSDGTLTPKELVVLAKGMGLNGLAFTDHDTFSSYIEYSKDRENTDSSVVVLPGVEVSTELCGENVHILGYSFDPDDKNLFDFCALHRNRRQVRNRQILEKLTQQGMPLTEEDIQDPENRTVTYGRPHIAMAMVKKGYVKDIAQAFKRYIGSGKPCYVSGEKWHPQEAIDAIRKAKGKVIIAHPHLIQEKKIIEQLITMPFDGIEVYYCKFTGPSNEKWLKIAREKNWMVTGGSDFHGSIKPDIKLGCSLAPHATFIALFDHFKSIAPHYC